MTANHDALFEQLGIVPFHRRYIEVRRGTQPVRAVTTSLHVREATADDGDAIGALFARCFDMPAHSAPMWAALIERPSWHVVVATEGPTIAGAGFLCVSGDEGYLAGGATDPAYRRRGAQGAVMSWRLQRALDLGCRWVWTETGEKIPGDPNHSYNNMLRHGFEPVATRLNFVPSGTKW